MRNWVLIGLVILMTNCSVEPQDINYGKDACHFCKMSIVDQQHAAEIVNSKGKAYKYDAIECMLRDKTTDEMDVALYLVMDYYSPNTFVDATKATYVISENIPSPMGAFLSAVSTESTAIQMVDEHSGDYYAWSAIKQKFKKE